ncbi:EAL domain-containing protein [Hwanghaeella grinnelliae]|uniref:EAL domain-containing protein n=1 Tax=Hwanghaeella grinnelliae TaxID=2500179 RepID=A0A3S2W804_9PROT|nr:EAL domain-containing response regulator [Hwanghaeella grinnelliae]RVU39477.1 EAL domain-containing protein [Hwanghaeella grinnelliae]
MEHLRVLVVDDETDMAEFVQGALESLQHRAECAGGKDAFCRQYNDSFDVIMLDLFMPDGDGIELLRLLSDWESRAAVVFMSGKDRSILNAAQRVAKDHDLPVLGTLQKPFTVDELDTVMGRYADVIGKSAKVPAFKPSSQDIKHALAEGQFTLFIRPQARTGTNAIVGGETLLRWKHPARGMVGQETFMPVAEECGLSKELIEFAATSAVKHLSVLNRAGRRMRLSVGVTPKCLSGWKMAEMLEPLCRSEGVDPDQLIIDVPEAVLENNLSKYIDMLTRLRIKGFILSISGFGTGRTALHQLVRMPINEIKLDRMVVNGMAKDPEVRAFAKVTVLVARELGIRMVGTGVNDQVTLDALAAMQVELAQGGIVGEPVEAAQYSIDTGSDVGMAG